MSTAFERVREIERAVEAGDLDGANEAAAELLPALVNERIDDMLEIRERIESLTLGVKHIQSQSLVDLRQLKQQRGGVAAYQDVQNHRG